MQAVVNGVLTNYEVINPKAKDPVLILHGWGSNIFYWLPLVKLLTNKYRYICLDLPGFGGTHNLTKNANVPDYTQFVLNFGEKIKLRHFFLVGHSFGGQIATDLSIKHPSNVEKLILISPASIRIRRITTKIKIIVTKIVKHLFFFIPTSTKNKIIGLYAPKDYVIANQFKKSVLHQILKYNLGPKLHLIKTPTEVIWGSEDHVIPYMGKYLVENIGNANLHILYGAGHLPHLTHPGKLARALNQILENEPS